MRKNGKKVLSLLLALVLCLGLVPMTALAAAEFEMEGTVLKKYNGSGGVVTVPDGVTSIGNFAFFECTSLTHVTIPDSVINIEENAFTLCSNLTGVTIPDSVISIGESAFSFCTSLTHVTIPNGVTGIANGMFSGCTDLESVAIPNSVTSIGSNAFSGCSSLKSLTVPDGVTCIGEIAFSGCTSLTSVAIPNGVTNIGEAVFQDCSNLTNVIIPNSVTNIGVYAFLRCESLTSVTIPDSVINIEDNAFLDCTGLKDVYFTGTEAQWKDISIDASNASLLSADIHYNLFTDVNTTDWYYDAVLYAYENGMMNGTSATTFSPNDTTTRGMIVTILHRMEGTPTATGTTFMDVPAGQWYSDAVSWASANGIVGGYGNGKFGPNDPITREQMATILKRYSEHKGYDTAIAGNVMSFSDASQVSFFALEPMGWAIGKDLISGVGNNMLAPKGSATRAQVATILMRFCANVVASNATETPDKEIQIDQGLFMSLPDEHSLSEDSETGLEYVNNELIVHADIGATKNDIIGLLVNYGGKIVGEIAITNSYQVRFANAYSYEELSKLQNNLEASSLISWTSANLIINEEQDYFPLSDAEWADEWNSTPTGHNWGVEAVDAPGAWEYKDAMDYTNVGVYDNYFYSHNDLTYKKRFSNTEVPKKKSTHGTHVSGTIAAGFDNGIGISGVAPYVNLYGYSTAIEGQVGTVTFAYELVLATLIGQEHCKVINVSQNTGDVACFAASKGNKKAFTYITENAAEIGTYLKNLIEVGNDFVICVAAGNVNGNKYVANKFAKYGYLAYDSEHPNGTPIKGDAQAAYNNFLNAITLPEVKNRIIVVGSCGNNENGTYTYSDFSNIGAVDVVAPGENIYSTINNNGYGPMGGTSMATPHVSGIAAMLYSIDPQIKGDRVKQIICETATTNVNGCSYKMVNAAEAVRKAYSESSRQILTLKGKIVDQNSGAPIENASITIRNHSGSTIKKASSNYDGEFSIIGVNANYSSDDAFWDTYSVEVGKEGYETVIKLSDNVVIIDKVYDLGKIFIEPLKPSLGLTISGKVKDSESNEALADVDVYIYDEEGYGPLFTGKTIHDGTFFITLEEIGSYTVKFTKEGYVEKSESVVINLGEYTLGTITLDRNSSGGNGGDGTESNPYQVSSAEQLQNVVNNISASYILVADINCSQMSTWIPIGTQQDAFSGHFNGNGHTISGLTCNQGLFGCISSTGTVENVNLSGFTVSAGQCGGIVAGLNNGMIQHCKVSGSISGTTGQYLTNFVGGIVGDNAGTIQYCSVSITGDDAMRGTTIGGIAGRNSGTITSCASSCSMAGKTESNGLTLVGGIVGYNYGGKINLCESRSNIVTSITYAGCACGGIAGANSGTISTSYFNGRVYARATTTNYGARAGGVVGSNGDRWLGKGGTISQCVYELSENSSTTRLDASDSSYCGTIENNYDSALSGAKIIEQIEAALNF